MNNVVFYRQGSAVSDDVFCRDVAAARVHIEKISARRVILFNTDCYLFCVGLFALILQGREVLLPANAQPATLAALSDLADATFGDISLADKINLSELAVTDCPTDDVFSQYLSLEQLLSEFEGTLTFFTSGSTGQPKPIVKECRYLKAEIVSLLSTFSSHLDAVDGVVCTVSHQHLYGLLFKVLLPLSAHWTIVNDTFEYPEHIASQLQALKTQQRWKKALFISSPAHLQRLVLDNVLQPFKAMLVLTFSSGGPLSIDANASYKRQMGEAPIEVFGSTETGGIAWRRGPLSAQDPWRLFDGIEYESVETGVQRLALRSPFIREDCYLSDDLVTALNSRQFVLQGRADRTVKIEEKRVNLDHVERFISADNNIAQVRVIRLMQRQRSILGVVAVLTEQGQNALTAQGRHDFSLQLKKTLQREFEAVCIPKKWRFIAALPFNAQGKVMLQDLEGFFE